MITKFGKRLFAGLLVMLMLLTMLPMSALAAATDDEATHDHVHSEEVVNESEVTQDADAELSDDTLAGPTELLQQVKAQMDELLIKHLGKTVMTEAEIYNAMNSVDLWNAWLESDALVATMSTMSEVEFKLLELYESMPTFAFFYDLLYSIANPPIMAITTVEVLDGKVSVTDSANSNKVSNGTVTITVKGSLLSKKTNNITVTNETDSTASLSFDYTADKASSFKIAGATAATSGTYTAVLEPGASVAITLVSNSGFSNLTATLTLSNISLVVASSSSNVTFDYDANNGSVTVNGTAVEAGTTQEVSLTEGATLVATPASGSTFLGWIDAATGAILSKDATYAIKPAADVTVKAVFISANSAPYFYLGAATSKSQSSGLLGLGKLNFHQVNATHIFSDLNAAANAAVSSTSKAIVLANNGTLAAGTYTIPAGVTLLIPFDAANTMYTTQAVGVEEPASSAGGWVAPYEYRKLTLAEGANIIINGAMSLSAKHNYAQGSKFHGGSPTGACSYVYMNQGSTITVNNGATLYAYGYVYGNGSVTAKSGSKVYENFQIADFRGGTQSTDMDNGVFPLSQYYVQNIEVPMTIEYGAKEYSYTTVFMSSSDFGSAVEFFGTGSAMFNLSSGYVVKRYDGTTDRLIVDLNGNMSINSINMTVGTSSINSKNYELPVNSNITVNVNSGSNISISQDISLLPGSQINIDNGATCTLGSGYNIYAYDADEWGGYASPGNLKLIPVAYAPGRVYTRTEADITDATIRVDGYFDASKGYVYTTAGGANVYSTGTGKGEVRPGTQTATYQLVQAKDAAQSQYISIPLTSAKLKNADGTYTETNKTAGTYEYQNGSWEQTVCIHEYQETVTKPATCTEAGLMTYTCPCGDTYTEEIAVAGHTPVTDAAVDATCTETGLTEGSHCDVCGTTLVAQEVVPAKGHTPGADATCTDAQTCTVCGTELEASLGHDYVSTVIKPTCTEDGYTSYTCSRCGDTYTDTPVTAVGHTPVIDKAVEPDCENTGLTEGSHCDVCGVTIVAQEVIPANGHTPVTDAAVEPDCENTGLTEGSHCDVCGTTLVAQEVVPANGHNVVIDVAVAPTCTETGLTEGKHCITCSEVLVAQEVVPATGHTPGADATCTDAQTCTVCGTTLEAALDHNYIGTVTEPTCTEDGYTTYVCSRCGDTYVDDVVEAKGHTLGEDADCTNAQTCTVCGTELEAALGHDHKATVTAPTCTEEGFTTYKCTRCGDTYTADVIPAKGHTAVTDSAVDATCTETGLTEGSHCSVCGTTLVAQEVVSAKGHTPVTDAAVEPTCTETGLTEGSHCEICGTTLVAQTVVPAKGHTAVTDAAVEPTCTETGLTEGSHCEICGTTLVAQEVVSAKGHTPVTDKAVEPTCTDTGLTEGSHCEICGTTLVAQNVVPVKGHTVAIDKAVEPDCINTGLTEGSHCSVCGTTLVKQNVVPAKGHTSVTIPAVEATCTSTGLTEGKYCSVCEKILVEQTVTEKAAHEIEYREAKPPSYTENGWEAFEFCVNCDYTTFKSIPALGEAEIKSYDEFMYNLALLEELASVYVKQNPGKDATGLVIKYIRTGVDRYNSASWGIMAGYEDADFAKFVTETEAQINSELTQEEYIKVSGLKNIYQFNLPTGDRTDFGHMFGAMDITYHNKGSVNHADVSGWAGDLVDLLSVTDKYSVSGEIEEMVTDIYNNYLCSYKVTDDGAFGPTDMFADLDAFYIMETLYKTEYTSSVLTDICLEYFTEDLTMEERCEYFLKNRLDGVSTRTQVRNAVYNAYTGNKVVSTLEGTREFNSDNLDDLRIACCYAFADFICRRAGDFVEVTENPYYSNFSTSTSILAPGVTQEINYATSADGKQMVYYLATADITRDDVHVFANYSDNDPTKWKMQRVLDQANAAQKKYGDPDSDLYIENYNVIASTNGDGYNMSTGEPGGLLVMKGIEYHPIDKGGFFAILDDGTAIIGTQEEWATYKDQVQEAIGGFGTRLVKDGEICVTRTESYYVDRAPRTAVGITRTGKVVLMVLDGRQEPFSCGGSMEEIAQIMREAGCVDAINLDGGGSSTFVARQEGAEELTVMNSPSDGSARSVSTSLMIVSTAPSSTAFDHARIDSDYSYSTIGTEVQLTPVGISATGNIAELPEGLTWEVSDSRWATVSEDGVFTGLRNGEVEVYLMNGETVVGSKTMYIVIPENIYFAKDRMDAVYGSTVTLPVSGLYEGKPVAINVNDAVITLDRPEAANVSGFDFTAIEGTGIKVVKATAALVSDAEVNGIITINLYRQGENTFDFDKATGGNRLLAWDRVVSNSNTTDNITYTAIDTNEDMVTSYIFAMDMTQIPIPQRLADLTYMLPGADAEDASAWNFLLQLAERVSVLTEVRPAITFDSDFDVDYSELKIMTDYFTLTSTEFDEETNTLTLILNWIDRTAAIDPATANPICLVNGVKLTPKDNASWDAKNRLSIVNEGVISYDIYLRANALYSFASKPENQEIYGLKPFINPNDAKESGASFGDVYAEFEDSYTLVNALKDGWYNEDGGFAFYAQGSKFYGVRAVAGLYYDFGDNGINAGKTVYTGIFFDSKLGNYCYAKAGVLTTGWVLVDGNWHYFDPKTTGAVSGNQKVGGVYYDFDARGKVLTGAWISTLEGVRYYYGPSYYMSRWYEIDGNWFYFRNGYRVTGISEVVSRNDSTISEWHNFGVDGVDRGFVPDGMLEANGKVYNIKDGRHVPGLAKYGEDYYFFNYSGDYVRDQLFYAWATSCDLPCGNYEFGPDGKMLNGIVEKDGTLYYYENGLTGTCGLIEYEGDYYYVYWGGKILTGKQYVNISYCDLPANKNYEFGEDGKMLQGVVYHDDGSIIYYENGVTGTCGLVEWEGDYYYVYWGGVVKTGEQYVSITYCDLPANKSYKFGADGKMLQGVVYHDDGSIIYYENGITGTCGLVEWEGDYYYVYWGGVVKTGKQYVSISYCDLPANKEYEFAADGKMLQGVVEKDGTLYFYENGVTATCGLVEWNGGYYYSYWGGVIKTGSQYVSITRCDLPANKTYEFGADGKMLDGIVEKDGVLYYYEDGVTGTCGLIEIDGDYYYVYWGGIIKTGTQYVSVSYCDLPANKTYEFGADGKMLNGIVEKDGQKIYYVNGITGDCGLTVIDGDYYYVYWGGVIKTGKHYVSVSFCDLPAYKEYEFDADGKILNGFVQKSDGLYYYVNGRAETLGVIQLDGYFYFITTNGRVITNQSYYVWKTNNLILESTYKFNELGQIVG